MVILPKFFRIEFQQRGSPHVHALIWSKNAPDLDNNSEAEVLEYVDKFVSTDSEAASMEFIKFFSI